MKYLGKIELPEHAAPGGFDHAAVHAGLGRLYVAHTGNDAVDVIDTAADRYLHSIPGLKGVAGALAADDLGLVFSSNRGENTIAIIDPSHDNDLVKIPVGVRPNGLAVDERRKLLLAANVGEANTPGSHTLSVVDIGRRRMIHSIPVGGRTRWTIFDAKTDCFYVNIAEPAQIAVVEAAAPDRVARSIEVPAGGPHGLDVDTEAGRLFCACDDGGLLAIDIGSGKVAQRAQLSGGPDVIFLDSIRDRLYVAVGEPGVMDVFEAKSLRRIETIATEKGAHTLGLDARRHKVYVFEPASHSAAVYSDETP